MTIEDKIRKIVADNLLLTKLELEKLNERTRLVDDLLVDEVSKYEVLTCIEIGFSVTISRQEERDIDTYGDLVNLVNKKLGRIREEIKQEGRN